ncbi:unnamed protein product [Rotaria socialis]|uniref:Uncharacterized protein n=2 Tax=Rotaria socialis TaxID=392032 RepID=A0A821D8J5_9BILA|nr:unnamed protein product [Rotaria socialis]
MAYLIFAITAAVTSTIWAMLVYWQLAIIMLCLQTVYFIEFYAFNIITVKQAEKASTAYGKAGTVISEALNGIRTVLAFNGAQSELHKYERNLDSARSAILKKDFAFGLFRGLTLMSWHWVTVIGLLISAIFYHYNISHISIDDILIIVLLFSNGILIPAAYIHLQYIAEAQGAAAEIWKLIDDESLKATEIDRKGLCNDCSINKVRFDNVHFSYPTRSDVKILNGITFEVGSSETIALVGNSGSGKSTCIQLLTRLYEPTEGQIFLDGLLIDSYNLNWLRDQIAVLNQEAVLFTKSIRENIRDGKPDATDNEIYEAAKEANAHDFIMALPKQYDTYINECGIDLSGGERQRIALARALIKKTSILLLDEPTSALDNANERIIQEALDRACSNRSVIIIAHRLSTVRRCNRIYVLENGCIVEQGDHATLMSKNGSYRRLVELQSMILESDVADSNYFDPGLNKIDQENVSTQSHGIPKRHFSSSVGLETLDINQNETPKKKQGFRVLYSLFLMSAPEWPIILFGCLACLGTGLSQMVLSILRAKAANAKCNFSLQMSRVLYACGLMVLFSLIICFTTLLQSVLFSISGCALIKRLRMKAFSSMLRQEVGWFDRSGNNSGALCARLSTDANILQSNKSIFLYNKQMLNFLINFAFFIRLLCVNHSKTCSLDSVLKLASNDVL